MRFNCFKSIRRPLMAGLAVLSAGAADCSVVSAQCAMCKQAIEASSAAAAAGGGVNLSILVMLIPPVAAFVGIFAFAYRHRHSPGGSAPDRHDF